ncbi:MAG: hypothetical protein IPM81_02160 [Saprospirales bacterium]|nr:hypothetical protein [Saprospirales bacterium]
MRRMPRPADILNRQQYALESLKNRLQANKCFRHLARQKSIGAGVLLTEANAFRLCSIRGMHACKRFLRLSRAYCCRFKNIGGPGQSGGKRGIFGSRPLKSFFENRSENGKSTSSIEDYRNPLCYPFSELDGH